MSGLTVGEALAPRKSSSINRAAFGDNGMTLPHGLPFAMTSGVGSVTIFSDRETLVVTGAGLQVDCV